jgi:superfamily II DNA or RNA helicase
MTAFAAGALVSARGREWVVQPDSDDEMLILRPLGGGEDDTTAVLPALEDVTSATFAPPTATDLGDTASGQLLRTALRAGFRSSAGPFRCLARLGVEPRAYQYVPLLMALRQDTVRLLIGDDVGIGKTIEAGLVASELLAQGDADGLSVLCSPALAEQWQKELANKFAIDAEIVIPATAGRLSRGLLLNESLFQRHRFTVVSTDFIKSPQRRHEYVNHCPRLVIVDEAHGCVADGAGGGGTAARTQRYDLIRQVAADPRRHLILVTATPHSGKEQGFRNLLGLLDPELAGVDLDRVADRERLARYFVQRRRGDIRHYLNEDTEFPSDREYTETAYGLTGDYAALFDRVLGYARGQVRDESGTVVHQRVKWWSALALLRALASSPAAASATLKTRATSVGATTVEEADALGRAAVLDSSGEDNLEGIDLTPGADTEPGIDPTGDDEASNVAPAHPERRRLLDMAKSADALAGPKKDAKLAVLIDEIKGLLADGYDPIVFCRFIDTADYVSEHLGHALKATANVAAVTGTIPPALREARIAELAVLPGRHVLIATDCLSEGVNLQDTFSAVVHYDLAWNPTRHEQREGRVDRFGQRRDIVRAVTIYGRDNGIDRIVLDVLIRKFKEIRRATGVSVPVPDDADGVVEALVEGLILRRESADQLTLDLGEQRRRDELHGRWESAAERERESNTKFAQGSIHPEEAVAEAQEARAGLGTAAEIESFVIGALPALGAPVSPGTQPCTWQAPTAGLRTGLRESLPVGRTEPLVLHRDLPVPRGHAVLGRTDPTVEAVARYVLDTALDPMLDHEAGGRVASRAGVTRTRAVTRLTTLLLLRFRFHLDLPGGVSARLLVAEEARFAAFQGSAETPEWLGRDDIETLIGAAPAGNVEPGHAADLINEVGVAAHHWRGHLDDMADQLAADLRDAHWRVRTSAGARRRGLTVTAQKPVDLLGVYIYLPVPVG